MVTKKKKDIVKRTSDLLNESPKEVETVVNTMFDTLKDILVNANPGERIEIRDMGSFEVKLVAEKTKARNPKTGDTFAVSPKRKIAFKAGKSLKEQLKKPLEN